jgi:N-acetylneuraminic acid mutarotase
LVKKPLQKPFYHEISSILSRELELPKSRLTQFLVVALLLALPLAALQVSQTEANIVEDSWRSITPMPTSIGSLDVAAANGKIYAISGLVNEEYDPATDTWTTKNPMPTKRYYFGIAVYQNKIYVIGGQSGYDADAGLRVLSAVNEVYDPATDTWETKASMPTPRIYLRANTVNDEIYVIGGLIDPDYYPPIVASGINEVYNPKTDTWTTKTPTPNPVYNYASAVVDNKIYLFAGGASEDDLTQIYDAETDTWSYGQRMPTKTRSIVAGATAGTEAPKRIYVLGGMQGFGIPLDLNRVYDPETDNWTAGAPMLTPSYGFAVAVVNDLLYAIGGGWHEQYTPIGYGTMPPKLRVLSPQNTIYNVSSIQLVFSMNKIADRISYSLDNDANVTVTGNTTLSGLSNGLHTLTVYAEDSLGKVGASETIYFSIEVPFPTTLVVGSIMTVVVISIGLLIYFKKRKR